MSERPDWHYQHIGTPDGLRGFQIGDLHDAGFVVEGEYPSEEVRVIHTNHIERVQVCSSILTPDGNNDRYTVYVPRNIEQGIRLINEVKHKA